MTSFLAEQVLFASKSRIQLTSIFGHFWPMRVPVRLNFTKVCVNFAAFCSWLVTRGTFRNDLSCFSLSFQLRTRQASGNARYALNPTNQFPSKKKKRRQSLTLSLPRGSPLTSKIVWR